MLQIDCYWFKEILLHFEQIEIAFLWAQRNLQKALMTKMKRKILKWSKYTLYIETELDVDTEETLQL